MSRPTHSPVAYLHSLTGKNRVTNWRNAHDGKYGPITIDDRGRQQVEIAAVERAEHRTFSDAQIARALKVKTNRKPLPDQQSPLKPLDPGAVRAAIEARDAAWRAYLQENKDQRAGSLTGLSRQPVADLSCAQDLFSRLDVHLMLDRAVHARDAAWRHWSLDPVSRALSPAGPAPFAINDEPQT